MTLDKLKVLLALNGNQRLPHLEEEIFADEELGCLYINELCKGYGWSQYNETRIDWSWDLCCYASDVLKHRWPEAEHIIVTDAYYAYWYARGVIKDRWSQDEEIGRKAEATIKTSRYWSEYYNHLGIQS